MARRSTERLAEVQERLVRWRERHGGPGRPIPEELWAEAAAVAADEGVDTTARALGVDRDRLARRVLDQRSTLTALRRVDGSSLSAVPTFVELPSLQSPLTGQSVVRFVGSDGEQMEIVGGIDVLTLVREFWSRAR